MARQLGDVLHYFLDEEPPGPPAEAVPCPLVTLPWTTGDADGMALLAGLAQGLRAQGLRPRVLRPEGPPALLASEARRVAEKAADEPGGLVLVPLPVEPTWPEAVAELLHHVWWVGAADDAGRAELLELGERVLGLAPFAGFGVTVRDATDLASAARDFDTLAELFAARFDRPLASHGLLLDDPRAGTPRLRRCLSDVATLWRADLGLAR